MPESKDPGNAPADTAHWSVRMEHQYLAYIMSSLSGTLYIGVTSDLDLRFP